MTAIRSLSLMGADFAGQGAGARAGGRSAERFRAMMTASPTGVFETGTDGRCRFVNRAFCELTGLSPRRALGDGWMEAVHPEDRAALAARWERAVETGARFRAAVRLQRAGDEKTLWGLAEAAPDLDDEGAIRRWVGTLTDVTELHETLESLRKARSSLADAQRIAHLGSWEWDLRSGELWWSEEVHRIFGLDPERFGASYDAFVERVHPDDRALVQRAVDRALCGAPYALHHRVLRPDGTVRAVHEQGEVLRDASGRPIRMVGTVHDVTEQRELEEGLRRTQRLEAVARLAVGVAHDFNNVLAVVATCTQQLDEGLEADSPLRAEVDDLAEATERAAELTRQLLAFGRRQERAPKALDLDETLRGFRKVLRRLAGQDVELCVTPHGDLPPVWLDRTQLEQLVLNLVVNARDALPTGGRIALSTATQRVPEAPDGRIPPGRYVTLTVEDDGVGIAPEDLDRIFEPFFTTKSEGRGTGLGLATVHGIMEQSGGHVAVESEPGRGTRFVLYFPPLAEATATAARSSRAASPTPPAAGCTILLVEDHRVLRRAVRRVLEAEGYCVLEVDRPEAASDLLRERAEPVDLLLTDVVMPRHGGMQLARRLRAIQPDLRVLFMSGYAAHRLQAHDVDELPAPLVRMPFTPGQLTAAVARAVAAP